MKNGGVASQMAKMTYWNLRLISQHGCFCSILGKRFCVNNFLALKRESGKKQSVPIFEVILVKIQVKLFVSRLKNDWDKLPSKMRKVYAWKDAVCLHAVCGAFISLLSDLQGRVPGNDYLEAVPLLQSQFDLGYLDPEIENMLLQPPPAPGDVPFFRTKGCCVCQALFL